MGRAADWFPSVTDVKNLLQDLADEASARLDAQIFDLMADADARMPGRPVTYQALHDEVAALMRGGMGANEASARLGSSAIGGLIRCQPPRQGPDGQLTRSISPATNTTGICEVISTMATRSSAAS